MKALGTVPTMAERMALVEHRLAEALERIAVLDQLVVQHHEDEDGPAPAPLASSWRPLKAAAALVGYSESGLRAAIRRHTDGPRWWKYRSGRLLVNIETCPKKRTRT
jgi:hypothetical protein